MTAQFLLFFDAYVCIYVCMYGTLNLINVIVQVFPGLFVLPFMTRVCAVSLTGI